MLKVKDAIRNPVRKITHHLDSELVRICYRIVPWLAFCLVCMQ